MPSTEDFAYTVRATSSVTGSDGSSSMATVCGTTLALLDAGVNIPHVAGISVGLVTPLDNSGQPVEDGEVWRVWDALLGDAALGEWMALGFMVRVHGHRLCC